jgi:uncharacterized protein (TIGR02996 family)
MDEQMAFVRAILKAPRDLTTRLVFADWLDEHDDPRGEYIRAAVAGERARLEELRKVIDPGWLPLLDEPPRQDHGRMLEVNPENLPVAGLGQLADPEVEVFTLDLSFQQEHEYDSGVYAIHFGVFVCGDRACVEFEDFDGLHTGEPGRQRNLDLWRSRNPDPQLPQSPAKLAFLGQPVMRGVRVDIHLGWTIPRADALMALAYHTIYFGPWRGGCNTFAPWVVWQRCDGCDSDSPPLQEPWRPRGSAPPMWSGDEDEPGEDEIEIEEDEPDSDLDT